MNEYYFQIDVTEEQVSYTNAMVDYSILHHPVTDIFINDPNGKERQREFRFTGSIGEVVFADTYKLERPKRAFGAIDGQDYGQDFVIHWKDKSISYDVKTMGRKHNIFRTNYVLNLPKYQMERDIVRTEKYFCISIHKEKEQLIASFIGHVDKQDILSEKFGILYTRGTTRVKDDGNSFVFQRDTYEVDFKDIASPMISERVKGLPGFQLRKLLPMRTHENKKL